MHIVGYHGTKYDNAQSIIKNGFDLKKCTPRDDHWLGKGIYFFVDKEFAYWWADLHGDNGTVLRSNIDCDDDRYLDLDRVSIKVAFLEECKKYRKMFSKGYKNRKQLRCSMIEIYRRVFNYLVVSESFVVSYKSSFFKKFQIDKSQVNSMWVNFLQKQVCVCENSLINNTEYDKEV